jgi:hypothetical protein
LDNSLDDFIFQILLLSEYFFCKNYGSLTDFAE